MSSISERDNSQLNDAKYDSHVITPQRDFVSNASKIEAVTGCTCREHADFKHTSERRNGSAWISRLPAFSCDHMMQHQRGRRCNFSGCPSAFDLAVSAAVGQRGS